jgi:hypothetical protein
MMGMYTLFLFGFQILYLTIILCCLWPVLVAPLFFYGSLVFYHMSGLAYREAQEPAG